MYADDSPEVLETAINPTSLREFQYQGPVTLKIANTIKQMKQLKSLNLFLHETSKTKLLAELATAISSLSQLEKICIDNEGEDAFDMDDQTSTFSVMMNYIFAAISNLPNLKSIRVSGENDMFALCQLLSANSNIKNVNAKCGGTILLEKLWYDT